MACQPVAGRCWPGCPPAVAVRLCATESASVLTTKLPTFHNRIYQYTEVNTLMAYQPDSAQLQQIVFLSVVIKQFAISLVFFIFAAVVMYMYRRLFQKVSLAFSSGEISLKASLSFALPVFVLLLIVGYAYIILSSPIHATFGDDSIIGASANISPSQIHENQTIADEDIRDLSQIIDLVSVQFSNSPGSLDEQQLLRRLTEWRNSAVFSRYPDADVAAVLRGEFDGDQSEVDQINFLMGR